MQIQKLIDALLGHKIEEEEVDQFVELKKMMVMLSENNTVHQSLLFLTEYPNFKEYLGGINFNAARSKLFTVFCNGLNAVPPATETGDIIL